MSLLESLLLTRLLWPGVTEVVGLLWCQGPGLATLPTLIIQIYYYNLSIFILTSWLLPVLRNVNQN